jgi:methylmalonyl-CoA/ethylmalonyl-CoA epimerase
MKIDHIGIATGGIAEVANFYREALGLKIEEIEEVAEQKVRVAMLPIGESRIELLEPTTTTRRFQSFSRSGAGNSSRRYQVENIRESLRKMKEEGARLIDEEPRTARAVALSPLFIHHQRAGF